MSKPLKILMSGGGTGGHIFPAIAIANKLKEHYPDAEIVFVGAKGRMEMEKVPRAGYPIHGLWISGFQRKLTMDNLSFPFKLISSLWKAAAIIKNFKPDIAIGTGGYASGPLLYMASRRKVPTLILEQNSYPGITNKILGKRVNSICVAYEGMENYFPSGKLVITGAPIRKEILNLKTTREEGLNHFGLEANRPVLLILGGSQGARGINRAVLENLNEIAALGIQIIWQTGTFSLEKAKNAAASSPFGKRIKVVDFIYEMDKAYAAADVLVSRAGAIAIAEMVAVGKPAILIPLPSAAEDHQTKNALSLAEKGAAILLRETEAKAKIVEEVKELVESDKKRMGIINNLKPFKTDDATENIVKEVNKLSKERKQKW